MSTSRELKDLKNAICGKRDMSTILAMLNLLIANAERAESAVVSQPRA